MVVSIVYVGISNTGNSQMKGVIMHGTMILCVYVCLKIPERSRMGSAMWKKIDQSNCRPCERNDVKSKVAATVPRSNRQNPRVMIIGIYRR